MTDDSTGDGPGPARQRDVYMQGMADVTPDIPVAYEDLEAAALEALDHEAAGYVAGGAGGGEAMASNRDAFGRYRIVPRMLQDVADRDLSVELFGRRYETPVALAPVGVLSIVHEDAEVAVARAASEHAVPTILSTVSSVTLEDVAAELAAAGWFQLYPSTDRAISKSLIERAEDAGYEALVITVDTPMLAWRERDIADAYLPFLDGDGLANYLTDPVFLDRLDVDPDDNELAAIREFVDIFGDPSLTWDDLEWLVEQTDLPVIVKGILHPEDARSAVAAGAAGVVVSNHGGRQVGRAIPALEALPDVVEAVGDETAVLYDSGIRRGADAVIALALGAEMILLGRPYVYGLALDGADGVRAVLANFLADLDLTLGLAGQSSIAGLDGSILRRDPG